MAPLCCSYLPPSYSEKLLLQIHVPGLSFNLDDPYLHQFSLKYNCLHDPHLRYYHNRKDILRLLKRQGFVTCDNKVVCTVKDFNEYRHYLTRLKLEAEQILGQQEEGLLSPLAKLKDGPKLPGTTTCWGKRRLRRPKTSSLPPPPLKSGRSRRGKIAWTRAKPTPELSWARTMPALPLAPRGSWTTLLTASLKLSLSD
ncbi:PREDICTED: fibrous sheath-interacting protein 2-like [Corvus brachyrhynchos]|uniref:fibrous sheath-interacting protein 2-like n=1 Tax=Corvus brachyrhynchos TaxID=85066 RepID=UPI00081646DF|nr:PREDICTED: fibrous sheath-interacting protein 2-like [Corvus brachyrhynchos]